MIPLLQKRIQIHFGDPFNNASLEIRRVLERHQFQWQQGSVYFGGPAVTAATVMVAVIDLATQLPWFAASVRDIRMLRIEELNDLMPVVQRVAGVTAASKSESLARHFGRRSRCKRSSTFTGRKKTRGSATCKTTPTTGRRAKRRLICSNTSRTCSTKS